MKIVNIVSGKGGTGKTLIAAVLADVISRRANARVLLIDIDIFVRGLTSLLFYEHERRAQIKLDQLSTSDIISNRTQTGAIENMEPGIVRYRTFDVWVSVRRIDDILDYHDLVPSNFDAAKFRLSALINSVEASYDLIFIDNRAGFDEFIAASHSIADISLNIADADLISKITSDNLVKQLEKVGTTPIYRIVNKAVDFENKEFADIGRIPFDAEILKSYGRPEFWEHMLQSRIELEVSLAWNKLADDENLPYKFSTRRVTSVVPEPFNRALLNFEIQERLLLVLGLVIAFIGGVVSFQGFDLIKGLLADPIRLTGGIFGLLGFIISIFSTIGAFRRR